MSIVSTYASPEAEAALRRQRRLATCASVVIALLMVALVLVILAFVLLPSLLVKIEPIVAYTVAPPEKEEVEVPEARPQPQPQPAAPSWAMARVVASSTPTPTSVPVPETETVEPSLEFGDGDDFGEGWGAGSGFGAGKGGTTFFGQSVKAERIAYVIDFSASMKGDREGLMRRELKKSVEQLHPGTEYALIFFAGPAWVAGDEVKMDRKNNEAVVRGKGGHSFKWTSQGQAHDWEHDGKKEPVEWLKATDRQISKSIKIIDRTKLVWGTVWDNPLQMALDMEPQPQVIYFMTDGAAKGSDLWAREIGRRASKDGVTINCIAMMQPRAHNDMDELAKRSKGQFTIIEKGGKRRKVR